MMHGAAWGWLVVWVSLGVAAWALLALFALVLARAARGTVYDRRYARHAYPDPKARERQHTGSMILGEEQRHRARLAVVPPLAEHIGDRIIRESGVWVPPASEQVGGWVSGAMVDPPGEGGPGHPPYPAPGGPGESEGYGLTALPAPSPGQRQGYWQGRPDAAPSPLDGWDEQTLAELASPSACWCGSLFVWTHYDDGSGRPSRYGPACGHDEDGWECPQCHSLFERPGLDHEPCWSYPSGLPSEGGGSYVPPPVMGGAPPAIGASALGAPVGLPDSLAPGAPTRLLEDTGAVELAALSATVLVELDRQDRAAREYSDWLAADAAAYREAVLGSLT